MSSADPHAAFTALSRTAVVCPLDDLACLRFDGADAATFLQGQWSNDIQRLRDGTVQRSSYNSPKGRMLASLLVWRHAGNESPAFEALVAADLAAGLAKRLSMYVLRAKVSVRDLSGELAWLGLAGPQSPAVVRAALGAAPEEGKARHVRMHEEDPDERPATLIGLADGRCLIGLPRAQRPILLDALARDAVVADAGVWRWTRIATGVPQVSAATSDQFVPQMLNFDLLDGISFQKGCYPGQEIVARTQYLGRLKERLFAYRLDGDPPAPGTRLYAAAFGEQACGTVVDASPHPGGGAALLAVVQRAVADTDLRLGAIDGPALHSLSLPYDVPEPLPPRGRMA
jgi:folate-binding protein YgfZ